MVAMHVRLMVLTSWWCIQHPSKKKLKFNHRTRHMPKPATEFSRDIESSVIIPQCTLNLNRLNKLQGGEKALGINSKSLPIFRLLSVWGGDLRLHCHKKGAREAVPTFELQGDWRTLTICCTADGRLNVFSVEEVVAGGLNLRLEDGHSFSLCNG